MECETKSGAAWATRRCSAARAASSTRSKRAVIKAQPNGAVRLSESTRASPLVPPALRAASSVGWDVLCAADVRRPARMLCCACGSRVTSSADVVLRVRLTRAVPRGCCPARAAHARRPARMLSCARGPRATSRAHAMLRARPTRPAHRPQKSPDRRAGWHAGAKPSCSLTRRPALSVERGMRDEMEEA